MVDAVGNGGWWKYLGILKDAKDTQTTLAALGPIACPIDGEPLITASDGQLFCKFDGWRPGGMSNA